MYDKIGNIEEVTAGTSAKALELFEHSAAKKFKTAWAAWEM